MEFKNSFLSRLFGGRPEAQEELEEEELLNQPSEDAPPPENPACHKLELPREHSLFKLRSVYNEQSGWLPLPDLTLEGPGEPPLPEAEAQAELLRLKMLMNATANKRFEALRAHRKEEGEFSLPDLDAQAVVFCPRTVCRPGC